MTNCEQTDAVDKLRQDENVPRDARNRVRNAAVPNHAHVPNDGQCLANNWEPQVTAPAPTVDKNHAIVVVVTDALSEYQLIRTRAESLTQ